MVIFRFGHTSFFMLAILKITHLSENVLFVERCGPMRPIYAFVRPLLPIDSEVTTQMTDKLAAATQVIYSSTTIALAEPFITYTTR
jgi:hypothetical protein